MIVVGDADQVEGLGYEPMQEGAGNQQRCGPEVGELEEIA
jgi:hypothetical protein